MNAAEILEDPEQGLAWAAAEFVRRVPHFAANDAVNAAVAEMQRRGVEPSWQAITRARAAARAVVAEHNAKLRAAAGTRPAGENEAAGNATGDLRAELLAMLNRAVDTDALTAEQVQAIRRELFRPCDTSTPGLAFVDFDPAAETPPPSWLAKGLLPRAGIGLLFGESGAGKSFAAIHAALCVAWGLPLFGAKVDQGAVLYIAAEGGKSVLRRFSAADRALEGQVASANVCRPAGMPPLSRAPIRVVHEAPDLSRDGDSKPLAATIRAAKTEFEKDGHRLALVIVDTWHAAMGGGDENSAADAGHALKPLIAESEEGGFLTLIVHHPGKDSDRGARGSNALPAAADAIIAVTVPSHEGAKAKPSAALRRATVAKMRDGEAGGEFAYRLPVVKVGIDADDDPITTCVVEPCDLPKTDGAGLSATDREILDAVNAALMEAGTGRARAEEARLRFYANRPDAKESARRMAWQRGVEKGIKNGWLGTDEHSLNLWILDPSEGTVH